MKRFLRTATTALLIGITCGLAAAPATAQPNVRRHDDRGRPGPDRRPVPVHNYDWNRPDPRYRGYYPEHYYRDYRRGGYQPVRVTRQTRIYRGGDGRYYCRRSDGTTGLIIGAALGGVIGNQLDKGRSNLLGTLLGAGAGGLLGRDIDRGKVTCR